MATGITNYQCPACTAPMHFDAESGKLTCDYCGSSYTPEEVEALYAEKNQASVEAAEKIDAQAEKEAAQLPEGETLEMNGYNCPSCGAELVCDETTAATSCPYCGNPTVIPKRFSGWHEPKYIIPFAMTQEDAVAKLKAHYKNKPLLPAAFSRENHIQEIRGVYVPFWLVSTQLSGNTDFKTTRSHTRTTATETITETSHYIVHRGGTAAFQNIPVDASTKMPDAHMDSIAPFDYGKMKPFSMSYLPGFLAEKYDVDLEQCRQRVKTQCDNSFCDAMEDTVIGYSTCTRLSADTQMEDFQGDYALLPVWLLATRWRNQPYLFAMNGQTGKMVGDLPIHKGKLLAWCAGIFSAVTAIMGIVFLVL